MIRSVALAVRQERKFARRAAENVILTSNFEIREPWVALRQQRVCSYDAANDLFLFLTPMSKHYHLFPRRAGTTLKWGLVAILGALLITFWPNPRRQIERQIVGMAEAVTHHGSSVNANWLEGLSKNIQANCSTATTTVSVEGLVNEELSQEQIIAGVSQIAADSSEFAVRLEHVTVDISSESNRALASADAVVEWAHENRVDRERRHVRFSLQLIEGHYRLLAVEASGNIVNQPEPRP